MSMCPVALPGQNRDGLLVSFMDCKLALIDYNSQAHDIRTLSLHYFEEDDELTVSYSHLANTGFYFQCSY